MKSKSRPLLVAIVGGSGAGKTWLAEKLQRAFAAAARLSLDDFYHDRSALSPARRAKINFDNPAAIDWASLETALDRLLNNRPAPVPRYDFESHCRLSKHTVLRPGPLVIVDGLWLLRRPRLRGLFDLKIFVECPSQTRLQRRLVRDLISRGRTAKSVREQFHRTVEPMHAKFVAPQKRWADVVLPADSGDHEVQRLAKAIESALELQPPQAPIYPRSKRIGRAAKAVKNRRAITVARRRQHATLAARDTES